MTDPSNWWNSKLLFRKVGFPTCSQKFLGISVTSLLVSICISKSKLLILTFYIMSFFLCSVFFYILVFGFFTEKTSILVSFSSTLSTFFFLNLHTAWKWFFFKQFVQFFPNAGHFPLFISCSCPQYEHFKIFFSMYVYANICSLGWLSSWLYFCINSCCYVKSMQVFKDIFPIRSCYIILYRCDALYIPLINPNWFMSSSTICTSYPSFLNSQYLLAFRRQCRYFMIGSLISCFMDMNFVLSAATNLFLGLIFFHMIWLIFSKVRSSRFAGYAMMETFIIASHPAVAKKRSVISFSPFFSLSSFSFLVLVLAAKHRSLVSTKSESSKDSWYPIDDAIVVMCKVSTNQSLIKLRSYSQCETYIGL